MSIKKLINCVNFNDFATEVVELFAEHGIKNFIIHPKTTKLDNCISSLPWGLVASYHERDLEEFDNSLKFARTKQGGHYREMSFGNEPINSGSKIERKNRELKRLFIDNGILHSYYNGYTTKSSGCFAVGIFGCEDNVTEFSNFIKHRKMEIDLICELVLNIAVKNFPNKMLDEKTKGNLQPKPLQVLELLAKEDLQLNDVASKMCISIDTANKHVARIKEFLDCKTMSGSIYKAIELGILNTDKN